MRGFARKAKPPGRKALPGAPGATQFKSLPHPPRLKNFSTGCAADGKTYKEALANVEIIIQEWIATAKELGRPIPAPRGRLAFA